MPSAGRILIMPKGNYDANIQYEMLDLVGHNGKAWLAKQEVKGIEPNDANNEYWHDMVDIDEIVDSKLAELDTGWVYPSLSDKFKVYSLGVSEVRYRRIGDIVYIRGAVTPTVEIASGEITTIFTLPAGYRPSDLNVNVIMQGTGMNRWCLSINTGGAVNAQRYGISENSKIPEGTWMNIDVAFPLGK